MAAGQGSGLKLLWFTADVRYMQSPFQVRARITELENEENLLRRADRDFWEKPEHTPEAQMAYNQRREKIHKIRRELRDLHRDLAIESVRGVKR